MSSTKTPASPATVSSAFDRRSRRDSITSQPMSPQVDKEQLAMALDKIHTSASQSDVLTTFNDFGPPPASSAPVVEPKGATSQQGLSGFYSRLKEAVGVGSGKSTAQPEPDEASGQDAGSSSRASHARSKSSITSLPRGDSGTTGSTFNSTSSSDFPGISATSSTGGMVDGYVQVPSAKAPAVAALSTSVAAAKPSSAGQALQKLSRAPASAVVDTASASGAVGMFQDNSSRASSRTADDLASMSTARRVSRPNEPSLHVSTLSGGSNMYDPAIDRKGNGLADITAAALMSRRDDNQSMDGSSEILRSPVKSIPPYHPSLTAGPGPNARPLRDDAKKPLVIDRLSIAGASVGKRSPSVVTENSIAEASPISMSAHGSVYHESFAHDQRPEQLQSGKMRIPGTTTNEGAPEMVNARLEHMRKQVLSKEFWMADETCKECFLCGDPFSAFRRKHHCRTCGWIFDAKCTSTISGQKFGVPGNLRVCKTCLDIINRRDDSGSDSDDPRLTSLLRSNVARPPSTIIPRPKSEDGSGTPERTDDTGEDRETTTPMMAIPATRRIGDSSNRKSAILEIDAAPQLSRPSSSRSLKSMVPIRPPSAGHMRHHSKHNFMWNLKPTSEERVPFRKDISDEMGRKSKLPAFHDDNIIDPELAPYMSDESSGDEQMSIFATLASNDLASSLDPDKPNFGPFLSAGRKHRPRGEKSISGLSFTSRGVDDGGSPSVISHSRTPARRRNMSSASGPASQHHLRSPRTKVGGFKGPALSSETLGIFDAAGGMEGVKATRPPSAKSARSKLSSASMKHTRKLFRQLLDDASIPNSAAWEKALVPILRKCAEDVDPDTGEGDRMDIRHYVKLKKIPGGKPSDSTYVSGVIFTKNLALKSMPRRISHPRILIVSFPIEYQRQQQHQFMSLEPVMSQEKEFLKMVVARIKNHQPEVVLAERNVAGLALQSLAEAGIAVAYNVKASVIGAVSRFVGTPIISSMDMLSLPIVVGRCAEFEVKTFVNNDIPGRKKTYIYLSGCEKYLGSTIALRGTSTEQLRRVKQITEFMVYVVYSLKLESCLLSDGSVRIASEVDYLHHTLSTMKHPVSGGLSTVDGSAERSPAASTILAPDSMSVQTAHSDESGAKIGPQAETTPAGESGLETSHPSLQQSTPSILSLHEDPSRAPSERQIPEDVPAPTFYSDMVEKYKTKILSSSPFVKFTQPYLLMKAREQETRLLYLKRLRDQDIIEEERDESGDRKPHQQFQLINPEMVHEIGQKAPRQVMEVLHAVHDAEYDKALYAYQTHMRQWENYIQGNLDLFDPYSHQNIVVLYSVTCTETKIPCLEPGLIGISYYSELPDPSEPMDADCTLGQYVQDLCDSAEDRCNANGCDQPMWQHHRTYVHGEARVTIFVEPEAKLPSPPEPLYEGAIGGYDDDEDDEDTIFLWSYCKVCKRDLMVKRLSPSAWKYSFGKYLELLFWAQGLRLSEETGCSHDCQTQHIRYFHYRGASVRIHYDPIDLLEVVVPRARLTWKVDHDLKLKNEIFCRMQERWNRFMTSVKNRIKSIRIDSVLPDKAESCKAEVDRLARKAQEEHSQLVRQLQQAYMQSKHYEIIPLNAAIRSMVEKIAEWDAAFAKFEADFLSDKDVRQLTVIQLRKMFTDTESKESSTASSTTIPSSTTDTASVISESEVKTPTSTVPTTTAQSSVADLDEKQSLPPSQPNDVEHPQSTVATPTADVPNPTVNTGKEEKEKTPETDKKDTTASPEAAKDKAAQATGKESAQSTVPRSAEGSQELHPATKEPTAKAVKAETEPPASQSEPADEDAPVSENQQITAGSTQTAAPEDPATAPVAAPVAAPVRSFVSPTPPAPSMLPVPVGSGAPTSPTRLVRAGVSSGTQQTLSEKVEQLRREIHAHSAEASQSIQTVGGGSSSAGVTDSRPTAGPARKSGPSISPPIVRSSTQPVLSVPRTLPGPSKQALVKEVKTPPAEMTLSGSTELHKTASESSQQSKLEKKFSDRIGLATLKTHRKPGPSAIPRFVHKKKESKVTSLARHFEQLSREFEKERNRERRQRAAKMHHPRAYFPKSSARAIVEVYDDVDQAVQESGPIDDEQLSSSANTGANVDTNAAPGDVARTPTAASGAVPPTDAGAVTGADPDRPADTAAESVPAPNTEGGPLSPTGPHSQQSMEESIETATEAETDIDHKHESAAASDDEAGSDADQSLEDILPDVETIAEHLEPSGTVPSELQKDKKSNLMKMLSNFWAERSSSGWPQLDYPINPTDHIFIDSDVIVREDEPSSLIAFALSSEDYIVKLRDIRRQGRRASRRQKKAREYLREAEARGVAASGGQAGDEDADDEEDGVDERDRGDMDGSTEAGRVGGGGGNGVGNSFSNDTVNRNNINNGTEDDDDVDDEESDMENFDAQQVGEAEMDEEALRPRSPESLDARSEEEEVEKSLLRPTGTHLKYQFTEGSARMMCKIFYAEQFDALRRKCGVADRIIESLSRCLKWDSKGGKTKSVFLKTLDDRFVMKALSPVETAAFLRFAPSYFSIMAEALFHELPSVIAKMLGFFQVIVKNAATGTEIKLDLLIMENLFYDRQETRKFDLKGSMRNRKIQSTGEQNEVLLDENMVEYIYESPLFAREHAKKLLRASVWNDTLFLARQNVMDYSLMVAVDESRKELVVGIIDCIRTYTWDKKLESWIKDRGFAGGGRNRPTVTSPKEYKSRFREAMERYILQAPNCWHLFGNMQYTHPALAPRARFDDE